MIRGFVGDNTNKGEILDPTNRINHNFDAAVINPNFKKQGLTIALLNLNK